MRKLSALRRSFVDFYENPQRFIDMSTLEYQYVEGTATVYQVKGKSLTDVTGLEKLGSGAYADVYAIDDNRVLKVIKSQDSAYARFVESVVRKLPDNPYLPRIFYQGTWGPKTVYIMERLEETTIDLDDWRKEHGFDPQGHDYGWRDRRRAFDREHQSEIDEIIERNNARQTLNDELRSAIRRACDNEGRQNRFYSVHEHIAEIAALLGQSRTLTDLHSGNVMFRGDTPVITDPACERERNY